MIVMDQEQALIRDLAAELGQKPDDYAGILRAVKARDGASGELNDIATVIGMPMRRRARGDVLEAVRSLVAMRTP